MSIQVALSPSTSQSMALAQRLLFPFHLGVVHVLHISAVTASTDQWCKLVLRTVPFGSKGCTASLMCSCWSWMASWIRFRLTSASLIAAVRIWNSLKLGAHDARLDFQHCPDPHWCVSNIPPDHPVGDWVECYRQVEHFTASLPSYRTRWSA